MSRGLNDCHAKAQRLLRRPSAASPNRQPASQMAHPAVAPAHAPSCTAPQPQPPAWPFLRQVTDGNRVLRAANGVPLLQQITATGCSGAGLSCCSHRSQEVLCAD